MNLARMLKITAIVALAGLGGLSAVDTVTGAGSFSVVSPAASC